MSKIHKLVQKTESDPEFSFFCPGCNCAHWFKTTGNSKRWTWNNNYDSPTISPSISVPNQCHSFVRDGKIQFLSDCKHKLAGKTVDLPDWNNF